MLTYYVNIGVTETVAASASDRWTGESPSATITTGMVVETLCTVQR